MSEARVVCGECVAEMGRMEAESFDLVLTDPPYFKVKDEAWDKQWDNSTAFLSWLDTVASEWQRLLKPNGSLYCFASPRMSARVETMLSRRFQVLNCIRWIKEEGWHKKTDRYSLRSWLSNWESIIFCEHPGADSIAEGGAGYEGKCDELRGFVFEPLRAYLRGEWERAGLNGDDANAACGTASMAGRHYFTTSQWRLPTAEHYASLRLYANERGRKPAPPYEQYHTAPRSRFESLRSDYEYLRSDYESLRRPFSVSAQVPYTDVWHFPSVLAHSSKHPCEKPVGMMRHIIKASSRLGAKVLDSFCGTGAVGVACAELGREFTGIEMDGEYCEIARKRIEAASRQQRMEFEEKSEERREKREGRKV